MANIRGLKDIRDNRGGGKSGDRGTIPGMGRSSPLLGLTEQLKDPREETFTDMIRLNFCPQLTFYSFSVIFSLILFRAFFIQIVVDGLDRNKIAKEFLPVNPLSSITGGLSNNYNDISERGQLWRFATSLLIHMNAYHLFTNILSLIIWASYFETFISSKRMPFNFFTAGILSRDSWQHICSRSQWGRIELDGCIDWDLWYFWDRPRVSDLQLGQFRI